jgi:hypothetical protein
VFGIEWRWNKSEVHWASLLRFVVIALFAHRVQDRADDPRHAQNMHGHFLVRLNGLILF